MIQATNYDIVIVGAGIVGATLALALAQKTNLSIALLEKESSFESWSSSHYHHRVSAITLASKRIFQALGVWENMQSKRVSPFEQIQVWDALFQGEIHFDCKEIAEPVLGFIIENNVMLTALYEKIKTQSQIEFISPVLLDTFCDNKKNISVTTHNKQFTAKLAIAADGAYSWLKEQAGIFFHIQDYAQSAIVAKVETALPHRKIAAQVFLESGPLAFLPLVLPNVSSIVWSLPTEQAKMKLALNKDEFKKELSRAFAYRLEAVQDIADRFSFPLYQQSTQQYIYSKVVLVGDAAHVVHPLAGQGVNMGLLDAASLAEVISASVDARRDFASFACLRQYERWRKADHLALMTGIDFIQKLFASDKKRIQMLRSAGLNFANRSQKLKNFLVSYAVGNRMGLPKMAKCHPRG